MDSGSPLEILKQLVRIPSQNPMGHQCDGEGWLEIRLSQWLCDHLSQHNVTHRFTEIESGRGNVIGWIPGAPDAPTIMLDAHQDTVPVTGMTIDPFDPVVGEGRLYGRGACDVKGSMAVILALIPRLQGLPTSRRPNVILSFTCDEELNQLGAIDLARRFQDNVAGVFSKPDFAIVSEPTDLRVVAAHKGVLRWKITVPGVAAHSSRPELGHNAIYSMCLVVDALRRIAQQTQRDAIDHPRCGRPTLSVGTIRGGQSVNIVPDGCEIEIDRRIVPGENAMDVYEQIESQLRAMTKCEFTMHPPFTVCEPLSDHSHNWICRLAACASSKTGTSDLMGVAFTTHAPKFARIGIPTVVFGPGSIDQAHTKDEWIEINQLGSAAEILYEFIRTACD